jgi:hypothetical protein
MTRAHMQKGRRSRRLGKQHQVKEAADWAKWAQGGRPRPAGPAHFEAQLAPL